MKYEVVEPFAWYYKGQVFEVEESDDWICFLEDIKVIRKIKEG